MKLLKTLLLASLVTVAHADTDTEAQKRAVRLQSIIDQALPPFTPLVYFPVVIDNEAGICFSLEKDGILIGGGCVTYVEIQHLIIDSIDAAELSKRGESI